MQKQWMQKLCATRGHRKINRCYAQQATIERGERRQYRERVQRLCASAVGTNGDVTEAEAGGGNWQRRKGTEVADQKTKRRGTMITS